MKIAVISDIHANLPALEAVIEHARSAGCETYWNLGDHVGYGPFPDETVDLIRGLSGSTISGNYDLKVLAFPKKHEQWGDKKNPLKYIAFQWAYEHLSKRNRKYLKKLAPEARVKIVPYRFLLTHGSQESNKEVILPSTSYDRLRKLGKLAKSDAILCGHSHVPFSFQFGNMWFLNPGSIGRPGDGDPRASYAILTIESESWKFQHYRLEYDVERTVSEIRARKLPEEFARMFLSGYSLDDLYPH